MEDTDTTGAITGGIAGIYYGYENIPQEWISELV
ncbi:ADP-ribosylglycohydrolase family protein, partial [Chryseobacterium sp. CH1]